MSVCSLKLLQVAKVRHRYDKSSYITFHVFSHKFFTPFYPILPLFHALLTHIHLSPFSAFFQQNMAYLKKFENSFEPIFVYF